MSRTNSVSRKRDSDQVASRNPFTESDRRALIASHAIAASLGGLFLGLVYTFPEVIVDPVPSQPLAAADSTRTEITFGPVEPAVTRTTPNGGTLTKSVRRVRATVRGALAPALVVGFGSTTGGLLGNAAGILRSVAVGGGSGGAPGGTPGKIALAHGGDSTRAPERGGIGGSTGGPDGIGAVGGGVAVSRAVVRVEPPTVMRTADQPDRAPDAGELGTFVRARTGQLGFCYEEHGLKASTALAGSVTIAIAVAGNGSVSSATITRRTWSGPGAAEAESCILRAVRAWRLPPSRGAGTFSFPVSFTR